MDANTYQRRIANAGVSALVVALVFVASLAYWQVFRTDLGERDGNPRLLRDFANPGRGRILDRAGNVLAASGPGGERQYFEASAAHAIGYLDARFGSQGAELAFNAQLTGGAEPSLMGAMNASSVAP